MPSREELDGYYQDILRSAGVGERDSMLATPPELARRYLQLIEQELGRAGWESLNILDYGAGGGEVSARLLSLGARVVAIEPYAHKLCSARGARTVRFLNELTKRDRFDGIVMTEVIEHVRDPVRALQDLRRHLKKDGWIFVTTPNNRSLKAWLLRGRWPESLKYGHLCLFSRRGLELSLSEAGFANVVRCSGSVRFARTTSRRITQSLLQGFGLDGQLRVMGWNEDGGSRRGD